MPELVRFDRLIGIPVHWGHWGRTGVRKLRSDFLPALEGALSELRDACPPDWGELTGWLSGGAYVPPPHPPRHSIGTAFDLSGMQFVGNDGTRLWELWREHKAHPEQALAVEAILRLHLPQVLGPWCNKDHEDHHHVDDREDARGFQPQHPSDVRYLQACLSHVWRLDCGGIDGKLGPRTLAAYVRASDQVGIADSPLLSWDAFLRATARGGLGMVEG